LIEVFHSGGAGPAQVGRGTGFGRGLIFKTSNLYLNIVCIFLCAQFLQRLM